MGWWSRTYNRPLRDPVLLSYTFEELLYEFYDKIERKNYEIETIAAEEDEIEEKEIENSLKWAEEQEKKDQEEWMQKQLEKGKEEYGEDFGEDIVIDDFEE